MSWRGTQVRLFPVTALALIMAAGLAHSASTGRIVLVAGGGRAETGIPATEAKLVLPFGAAKDPDGNLVIVELTGGRVLRIDRRGVLTRIAGTGEKGYSGDGGPALQAKFNSMHSLAIARNGDLYVADTLNFCVRKIAAKTGTITTLAGTGAKGYSGDGGPANKALCGGVYCVALAPNEKRLYLADLDNRRIRMVDLATGIITTVAGNGERGVPKDGSLAAESPLVDPRAVAADSQGNVWVLERGGHALRVVDKAGRIRTVVGTGKPGYGGDGGPGRQALVRGPKHLCLDRDENVIIADTDNHVIRKYLPGEDKIVAVAGTGKRGVAGVGGPPDKLEMHYPHGVFVDEQGVLTIVDSHNHRVLKIVD